jgi:2-iminobutanoate/2-iminopropanoate deaminase
LKPVFGSGILPIYASGRKATDTNIDEQADVMFLNLSSILYAAGCSKEDVVKVTLFISDIALWDQLNLIYSRYFGSHKPARSIVPLGCKLHHGFDLELEFVAYKE